MFSPALTWRVMSSRDGFPITPPAGAVDLHRRRVVGQVVHLQEDAAMGQIHVGRNRHAAAERIGRLHRAERQRPALRLGHERLRRRVRIARRWRSARGPASCPARSASGRAIFVGWNTISTRLQRLQRQRELHLPVVDPLERDRGDLVPHGVPALPARPRRWRGT